MNSCIKDNEYYEIENYWKTHILIKVVDNEEVHNNRCTIYCSSNGLWKPDTIEAFRRTIDKDYYEWQTWGGTSERSIYIRDIFKEWYVRGIGGNVSTIDSLIEYLKSYVQGFDLVLVGNSAGGYIAMILGISLHAKWVISIAGQVDITTYLNNEIEYPELLHHANDISCKKYFNITSLCRDNPDVPIIYIYSGKNEEDLKQVELIMEYNSVMTFRFNSKMHGITVKPYNYPSLIDLTFQKWVELNNKYKGKMISARLFAIDTIGIFPFLRQDIVYTCSHLPQILKNHYHVSVKPLVRKIKKGLGLDK